MPIYVVKSVSDEPRAWTSGHGGSFLSYKVDLESDGVLARGVEWNKKDSSPAPSVGEKVAGILEDGRYGDKFKIDYEATKELGGNNRGSSEVRTASAGSSNAGGKGNWQPESERDPEKTARIGRAHAQHMAILTCEAMGLFESVSATQIESKLFAWVGIFEKDVNKAGEAAKQAPGNATPGGTESAATSPASASSAPASRPADDTHQFLCTVIETAGLAAYPASKLADFVLSKLNPEQRKRAESGLSNLDTAGETLAKLKTAYEQAEGPLPAADADDGSDIPF